MIISNPISCSMKLNQDNEENLFCHYYYQYSRVQTSFSWLNSVIFDSFKAVCFELGHTQKQNYQQLNKQQKQIQRPSSGLSNQESGWQKNLITNQQQLRHRMLMASSEDAAMYRPYDVVIFGASSSVGKFLVEEMALVADKYYSNQKTKQSVINDTMNIKELRDPIQFAQATNSRRLSVPRHMEDGIKWAVAGRSATKLSSILCQAELSTGIKDLSLHVPVLLADLNHHKSLLDMCRKTNLIINCVGPYSMNAEVVIKSCLETQTNYIDLSHETTFIEQMRIKYSKQATRAKIYIINGCGFQSMSAEMGLNFIKQVADGQIEDVKVILNLNEIKALTKQLDNNNLIKKNGIFSWGMWCSLLMEREQQAIANQISASLSLSKIRTKNLQRQDNFHEDSHDNSFDKQNLLKRKDTQTLVKDSMTFKNRSSLTWLKLFRGFVECGRRYCLPINSLTSEESQLIRGEMANYECRKPDMNSIDGWRPISCTSFMALKSFSETILLSMWLIFFNILVNFSPFRMLMRTFPTISTLGLVTNSTNNNQLDRDSLSHIKFCQTFLAFGTPGDGSGDPLEKRDKNLRRKQEQLLVARVVGPEPNHVATATYAIQAALAVILEKDHLPLEGGILTPGAAFADTNIIYQLRRRNIKFEVMKKA